MKASRNGVEMTKCYDCGEEGAHYLSRTDAEIRCYKCELALKEKLKLVHNND